VCVAFLYSVCVAFVFSRRLCSVGGIYVVQGAIGHSGFSLFIYWAFLYSGQFLQWVFSFYILGIFIQWAISTVGFHLYSVCNLQWAFSYIGRFYTVGNFYSGFSLYSGHIVGHLSQWAFYTVGVYFYSGFSFKLEEILILYWAFL
jgi:hypothetical protein